MRFLNRKFLGRIKREEIPMIQRDGEKESEGGKTSARTSPSNTKQKKCEDKLGSFS